jgi:hypothetical protein
MSTHSHALAIGASPSLVTVAGTHAPLRAEVPTLWVGVAALAAIVLTFVAFLVLIAPGEVGVPNAFATMMPAASWQVDAPAGLAAVGGQR